MSHGEPPEGPLAKMKSSLRIYVSEWGSAEARHLVTLTAAGDGGLMVIPNNHTQAGWDAYVQAEASFSRPDHVASWPVSVSPRLHYHRSGYTNIEPQGLNNAGEGRPSILLPTIESVTAKQIFSLTVTRPDLIPTVPLSEAFTRGRRDKWVNHLHDGIPSVISVAGLLYTNRTVPWWREELEDASNPFLGLRGRDLVEAAYSLVGHGIESFLVIRFGHDLEPAHAVAAAGRMGASITLSGFCGLEEWPSPSIHATTSGRGIMWSIFERAALPRFDKVRRRRSWDRARVYRDANGNILHREKM